MQEKKYLKWYNKVGYGSGDLAANMVYALLTSFVMIYLTDDGRTECRYCRYPDDAFQICGRYYRCIFRLSHRQDEE